MFLAILPRWVESTKNDILGASDPEASSNSSWPIYRLPRASKWISFMCSVLPLNFCSFSLCSRTSKSAYRPLRIISLYCRSLPQEWGLPLNHVSISMYFCVVFLSLVSQKLFNQLSFIPMRNFFTCCRCRLGVSMGRNELRVFLYDHLRHQIKKLNIFKWLY